MTITVLPMDATAGSPAYSALRARQAQAPVYGNPTARVFGGRSGWRVGTLSNIVSVTSTTWTLQPCSAMIEPAASLYQGLYGWASDQVVTGGVTAADANNPRTDILYIQVNDSSAGDGSGALSAPVSYLAGTAAATPAAPTLPARAFLVATFNVPKAGGGSPTATLNPQYFVAAGGLLPVSGTTERGTLTPYNGFAVTRTDTPSLDFYSGGGWYSLKPSAALNGGAATDLTGFQGTWVAAYTTGNRRPRVWSTDGVTAHVTGLVQYNGSTGSIVTIPAGYAPADASTITHVGASAASNGPSSTTGGPILDLGIVGGILQIVYQSGSIPTGSFVPLHGSWRING